MDTNFKTTFIPKKKLAETRGGESIEKRGRSSLLSLLATLLFITAIISMAGVYFYRISLETKLKKQIASINIAEKSFEPGLILELKKLDIRLNAATDLLNQHIALSDFFKSLGESTLPAISFKNFSFSFDKSIPKVKMEGEANGYLPIAQQSDQFEKNQYIKNHIFSDFKLTEHNTVSFQLNFTLDPQLILYGRKIRNVQVDSNIGDNVIIENKKDVLKKGKDINFNSNI